MLSRRSNLWSRASGRSQALSEDPDVKVVQLFADVSLAADLHNVPQSSLGPLAPFMILMSRVLWTVFWGTSTKCFLSPFFYMGFDFELNRCNIPSFSRQAMFWQSFMVFFAGGLSAVFLGGFFRRKWLPPAIRIRPLLLRILFGAQIFLHTEKQLNLKL